MAKTVGKFVAMILLVMVGIYGVKFLTAKFNIPILKNISEGV